jgi:glycosyltransferase involved in cell wall biosynthesis
VLSQFQRKLVSKYAGISMKDLGVIDRYSLFPCRKRMQTFPQTGVVNFVTATRLATSKNPKGLLCFVKEFRKHTDRDCRLHIFGPHSDRQRWIQLFKKLKCSHFVTFKGDLGSAWVKAIKKNPVYLNVSTGKAEAFSVGLAEAQQQGWPSVLVNSGCFRDDLIGNVIRIPEASVKQCRFSKRLLGQILLAWTLTPNTRQIKSHQQTAKIQSEAQLYRILLTAQRAYEDIARIYKDELVGDAHSLSSTTEN